MSMQYQQQSILIQKIIKSLVDTLLISIIYLFIACLINDYFNNFNFFIFINYCSTIFIKAIIISFLLQIIFKKTIKTMKRKKNNI